MKIVLRAAIGIVIEMPDDHGTIHAPLNDGPLDELAVRLQQETCRGRDAGEPALALAHVPARITAICQEWSGHN